MPVRWSQRLSVSSCQRPLDLGGGQARARRSAPGVDDLGRAEHSPFPKHQPGRGVRIDREVRDVDALAPEAARDRLAEAVGTDPADEGDRMTEPRESDRDVRLGAHDEALEGGRLGQRAGGGRHERDEALPEGDDLGHRLAPCLAWRDGRNDRGWHVPGSRPAAPSPSSQPPIPTATAPAAMNAGAVSTVTPPVGTSGISGNGPLISRTKPGPADDAGKSLTAAAPARHAARISVGVAHPGNAGMPRPAAHATSSSSRWGITRKVAPASIALVGRLDRQDRPGADLESEVTREVGGRLDRCEGGVLGLVQRQLECADATGRQGLGDRRDRGRRNVSADGDDAADEQPGRDRRSRRQVGQVVRLRLVPIARSVLDSVAPAYHRGVRTVTLAELAEEAGAPVALVERLVAIGQVRALPDGRFDPRDEAVIGTVRALLEAGIPEDDVDWLVSELGGGFQAVGGMFEPPGPRATGSYAELRADLGPLGDRLPAVFAAFGLPEPAPDHHLRDAEER